MEQLVADPLMKSCRNQLKLLSLALILCVQTSAMAQDITIENREAIIPATTVPGLSEYAGRAIGEIPFSFPNGLLEELVVPQYETYMGMTRDKAPESIAYHFSQVIQGPPGTKSLFDGQYAIFSACRLSSCPEKGWFIMDISRHDYLGAIRHFYWGEEETRTQGSLLLFSDNFETFQDIPELFLKALTHWAETEVFQDDYYGDTDFSVVRFINAAGVIETVCSDCIPR